MSINVNKQPYFDDFDGNKNFVSILFKPSKPVQTRELNQIQSIQHHQLERFADHVFKHGALINGNAPKKLDTPYVTLEANSPWDNSPLNLDRLNGKVLRGRTSQIEAILVKSVPMTGNDPNTIYVNYTLTAVDQKTHVFLNGEVIDIVDNNGIVTYSCKVRCPTCAGSNDPLANLPPTGKGTLWSIPESTYYVSGYFVDVGPDILVAEKYSTDKESYTIGFDVVFDIVTADDDPSLYDNALGYPNYSASGADRARIRLIPAVRSTNYSDGENFVTLARVIKGITQYVTTKTDYAALMDTLAERTYDQSGNYTVIPFQVKFFEHLKKSADDPNGYFTVDEGGNDNLMVGIVSPGKAYVKGYQVERISESMVFLDKARETKKLRNQFNRFSSLNYVLVTLDNNSSFAPIGLSGSGIFTNESVDLYDGAISGNLPTGAIIGKMKVYDVEYDSTVSGVDRYRLYVANISMNPTKTYDMVKSLHYTGAVYFAASTVNDDLTNNPKIYNSNSTALIWDIGCSNVKSLHDADNPTVSNAGTNEVFDSANPTYTLCGVVGSNGAFTKLPLSNLTITPSSIQINAPSYAGKTFILFHGVITSNAIEKTKTLVNKVDTGLHLIQGALTLTKSDLFKLTSITTYNPNSPNNKTDVTNYFTWTTGQTDDAYVPIVATANSNAPSWDANNRFEVTYTYYEHSPGDFFIVDSYRNIIDDTSTEYGYEDIPYYKSSSGVTYDMRTSFDFRPLILDTSPVDAKQPSFNGIYKADIEYYLPRIDMIVINKDGDIFQKKGISSESPVPPRIESGDEMAIYQVNMKPFVYDIKKDVTIKFIENKRYTMRDIGRIEERISNIEYQTVFSLLEKQSADMSIKDANGFDRFKNGFIVDNFMNYQAADLGSNEFRAALDRKAAELRPSYTMFNTKFDLDEAVTKNARVLGTIALIDYDSVTLNGQPYASKHISVNPYSIYEKKGKMVLSPNNDSWCDVNREPNMVVSVDTGIDAINKIAQKSGVLGTEWGAWGVMNTTISSRTTSEPWSSSSTKNWTSSSITGSWSNGSIGGYSVHNIGGTTTTTVGGTQTTTVTTTTQVLKRDGIRTTFDTRTRAYDLGDRVTDINIIPYMRSINVEFHATGMKPNTRLYAFFDGVDVTSDCRPLSNGSEYGSSLVVDSDGNVSGVFRIPSGRFFNGQKTFRLTNDPKDSRDPDLLMTSAEAIYWAGGVDISKQSTTMNVITPTFVDTAVSETTQNVNTTVSTARSQNWSVTSSAIDWQNSTQVTKRTPPPPPPPPPAVYPHPGFILPPQQPLPISIQYSMFRCADPLAQTFHIDADCFITEVDLWFHSVSESDVIFVQIKNTENGYPGEVVLGETILNWDKINADTSGVASTRVTFPYPIFVEGGKDYALIVGGNTPDTRVWISVLGQEDVTRPGFIIDKQPSLGSLFKSQNNSTWTASQDEDLKYAMYCAYFKYDEMTLGLKNSKLLDETIVFNPFETQQGSRKVRVHANNHGAAVGDKTNFKIGEFTWLNVSPTSGQLVEGQTIVSATGSAIVKEVKTKQDNTVDCELSEIKGHFVAGQSFSAQSITPKLNDEYLITNFTQIPIKIGPSNVVNGVINQDFNIDINGIPLDELNDELTILAVDSADSFIVEVNTPASSTGFAGGNVIINSNQRYEMFNVSGSFMSNGTDYSWSLSGIGHKCNGLFESQDYVRLDPKVFTLGQDAFVGQPYKFANSLNETRKLAGDSSIKITGNFKTKNPLVSPVINLDTFNMVGVANRVEFIDPSSYSVEPNALNQLVPETDPMNGSEAFKYVTRTLTLQNPALDAKILVDAYKPVDSDFDIYVKVLNPWERVDIDTKPWILIENVWKDFISTSLDDFREVEFNIADLMPTVFGSNEFSSFKVKIVGRAKNPANPPLFKNFRALAVT
jgi:hypothetical protein